jgi:hypothetical protein
VAPLARDRAERPDPRLPRGSVCLCARWER